MDDQHERVIYRAKGQQGGPDRNFARVIEWDSGQFDRSFLQNRRTMFRRDGGEIFTGQCPSGDRRDPLDRAGIPLMGHESERGVPLEQALQGLLHSHAIHCSLEAHYHAQVVQPKTVGPLLRPPDRELLPGQRKLG
jgi:hypothetical protein